MSIGVRLRKMPALDGLRGAAVAGVLLFHGGHLTGGYLGVDLFFVLSGFLITSLLLVESGASGTIGLGGFWARRARRLLPALAGLLVGVVVYCLVFADPSELAKIRGDALATLAYGANWREVFATQDYWALFRAPSPLQHAWSLAIEEQFYLVWPLVFVGLLAWWKTSAPKAVLVTAVLGACVSGVLMVVLYDQESSNRAYYGTDTRAAGILLGAALAAALVVWGPVRSRAGRIVLEGAGFVGIAGLFYAWTQLSGESPALYHGGLFACGLAAVAVIAAGAHPEAGPIARVFSFRPLCLLGLISYGVYLWHWPVYIVLDSERVGWSGWPLLAVQVAVTLVIAIVSYRFLEQPIRHGALDARVWRITAPAAAAVLVAVVFLSTTSNEPVLSASSTQPDSVKEVMKLTAEQPDAKRVLIVGNSLGYLLGVGMKDLETDPPMVVFNDAVVGCTLPWGASRPLEGAPEITSYGRCDAQWGTIVRRFQPDVVLVVLQCCSSEHQLGDTWLQPCDPRYAEVFDRDFRKLVRRVGQTGAHVVITTSPYTLKETLGPPYRKNLDCSNELRKKAAQDLGVQLVDLGAWTCPEPPYCRTEEDGVTLRPDRVHFEGEGAHVASRWLLNQLPASSRFTSTG